VNSMYRYGDELRAKSHVVVKERDEALRLLAEVRKVIGGCGCRLGAVWI
jgi:hypothetical protein